MRNILIQFFIAAARQAAEWPMPHWSLSRAALCSIPSEHFNNG
jgi:hypothetical protein